MKQVTVIQNSWNYIIYTKIREFVILNYIRIKQSGSLVDFRKKKSLVIVLVSFEEVCILHCQCCSNFCFSFTALLNFVWRCVCVGGGGEGVVLIFNFFKLL